MGLFRKKPVTIEAMKYTGRNGDEIAAFMHHLYPFITGRNGDEIAAFMHHLYPFIKDNELKIGTLEGVMSAKAGDWIIRGVKGEYYPIKNDIFLETYEPEERAEHQPTEQSKAQPEICPHYYEATDGVHACVVGQCACHGKLSG